MKFEQMPTETQKDDFLKLFETYPNLKDEMEKASSEFWSMFDVYVKQIESGEKAERPSRSAHIREGMSSIGQGLTADRDKAIKYWGELFDREMASRNLAAWQIEPLMDGRLPDKWNER